MRVTKATLCATVCSQKYNKNKHLWVLLVRSQRMRWQNLFFIIPILKGCVTPEKCILMPCASFFPFINLISVKIPCVVLLSSWLPFFKEMRWSIDTAFVFWSSALYKFSCGEGRYNTQTECRDDNNKYPALVIKDSAQLDTVNHRRSRGKVAGCHKNSPRKITPYK